MGKTERKTLIRERGRWSIQNSGEEVQITLKMSGKTLNNHTISYLFLSKYNT